MDRRIRWLGMVLLACFALLFLQLNNLQVREATALRHSPYNVRVAVDPFELPRGEILSSGGVVLAESRPTKDGYGEQRIYPFGSLFTDVTGYYSVVYSADTGIEAEYNSYLTEHETRVSSLGQLLTQHEEVDDVVLTVSARLQRVVQAALAGRIGGVVVLDPRTGAVLALYGNPTFDPNLLASHDASAVHAAYAALDPSSPTSPLVDFPLQRANPPGSTFKVVTTTAIFATDPKIAKETFPYLSALALPDTTLLLHNYAGETCGGTLAQALAVSCDTSYAMIGLQLGAQRLAEVAQRFGFNQVPPLDFPPGEVAASSFPLPSSPPALAYSAFGQESVTATAFQMALVGAGVADNGVIMTPHLLERIVNSAGVTVLTYRPHPWRRVATAAQAEAVRTLMLGVTRDPYGTGYGLFPSNIYVAGKTGTAQTGHGCDDAWFLAIAPAGPGQTPTAVVAVDVPYQSGVACQTTGYATAGPIASTVLQAALSLGL